MEMTGPFSHDVLKDQEEGRAFGWLAFFSLIPGLLILLYIIFSYGTGLILIGIIALARYFAELFAVAYIKTNAVEVSEQQFPEVYQVANAFAQRLGEPLPSIYILQSSVWNALAMKVAGRRMVVLLSGAVDSILLKGSLAQLAWLVGHELGHHYAGHLDFFRNAVSMLGSWCIGWGCGTAAVAS